MNFTRGSAAPDGANGIKPLRGFFPYLRWGRLAPAQPLNPLSLRDFPLSGGYGLHYIPAGGSTAAIFKENLADVPPRRLMPPSLMWIPSANNIADVDFANVKPLNPTQLLLSAPSGLLCLSSPVAYNSKLSPAKVSQPQLLTAQRPQRGEPFGRAPRSCGRSSRSAYIPAAVPVRIFSSKPSPVKITWNMQILYRYL